MAIASNSTTSTRNRRPRGTTRSVLPTMTERELDAYLLARDTLRRLRDAGWQAAFDPPGAAADKRS